MGIARLEVSTQQHLERMQETAKVNYVQYGKSTKSKKGKKSTQSGAGANSQRSNGAMELVLNLVERVGSFHSCKTLATDMGRQTPKSTELQSCGCNMQRLWKERTL